MNFVHFQVIFYPGETKALCHLTILDDDADISLEGQERFQVFISTPHNAALSHPMTAEIIIDDLNDDVPALQFGISQLVISENSTKVKIPIKRSGDLSGFASVKCFTRQRSAKAGEDFVERPKTEASRVIFSEGIRSADCEIDIIDDQVLEGDEEFVVKLIDAVGNEDVRLGDRITVKVKIQDREDIPRIEFERDTYSILEPTSPEKVVKLLVKVMYNNIYIYIYI